MRVNPRRSTAHNSSGRSLGTARTNPRHNPCRRAYQMRTLYTRARRHLPLLSSAARGRCLLQEAASLLLTFWSEAGRAQLTRPPGRALVGWNGLWDQICWRRSRERSQSHFKERISVHFSCRWGARAPPGCQRKAAALPSSSGDSSSPPSPHHSRQLQQQRDAMPSSGEMAHVNNINGNTDYKGILG